MTATLERDPVDGEPKPKRWWVTIKTSRLVEVDADSAAEAEEKARDNVLFADEFPIDRDEITDIHVGWVDPGIPEDLQFTHVEGCWGNHCRHYDCDATEMASCHDEWCSACEP